MDTLSIKQELSNEAINLIKEIITEIDFLGENLIRNVKKNENGQDIIIESEEVTVEYSLSEVSYLFSDCDYRLWKNGESFFEALENCEKIKDLEYKKMNKNEFISKFGKLEHIKLRSKDIVNRLREIEREV